MCLKRSSNPGLNGKDNPERVAIPGLMEAADMSTEVAKKKNEISDIIKPIGRFLLGYKQ